LIVGSTSLFGIESGISEAYERLSSRALGYFVIHVGGLSYGRRAADSSMLACSFDEVEKRIAMRGAHRASFAAEPEAGRIADAFRDAVYGAQARETYLGIPRERFVEMLHMNRIMWAPDGDEAFDDGSYVLQFDILDSVRLIAFKSGQRFFHDPATLRDISLKANDFYGLLQNWRDAFRAEWSSVPKRPESGPDNQTKS